MSRVKRGVTSHAKHKKVYKAAKGFYGRRKNTIRAAKAAVEKAGQYAFRDRKRKKRTFRALWIQRLNAAVRPFGMTYSRFIDGLSKSGAKKRFKVTGTGKVMYAQRGKRHGMIKRTKKQIRQLRGTRVLFKTDGDNVKKYFLPNA